MASRPTQRTNPITLLGRLYETIPRFLRPVEFRAVQTTDELKAAARLVYQEYLKRNYTRPNASRMKLSIYHTLPTTTTFIALHRSAGIIGTISLIEDSPLGLPMDEVYRSELDRLRQRGLRLAEASMLSLNGRLFGHGVFTMFHAKKLLLTLQLFKVMFDYLKLCTAADELVACFNPKHQLLYEFLQLKPLGGLKVYPGANRNPAVARHLNIAETRRRATSHAAYRLFYGQDSPLEVFAKKLQFSPEDLRELFVVTTSILSSASPSELSHLQQCYPTYSLESILHGPAALSPAPPAAHSEFALDTLTKRLL